MSTPKYSPGKKINRYAAKAKKNFGYLSVYNRGVDLNDYVADAEKNKRKIDGTYKAGVADKIVQKEEFFERGFYALLHRHFGFSDARRKELEQEINQKNAEKKLDHMGRKIEIAPVKLQKIDLEIIALARYAVSPEIRNRMLDKIVLIAHTYENKPLLQAAFDVGITFGILEPLDTQTPHMNAKTHLAFMQKKMVHDAKKTPLVKKQFHELEEKIAALRLTRDRDRLYKAAAVIHPDKNAGKALLDKVHTLEPKPRKEKPVSPLDQKINVLTKKVKEIDPLKAAYDFKIMLAFENVVEEICTEEKGLEKGLHFDRIAKIHPVKEDAEIFSQRAYDTIVTAEKSAAKTKKLIQFRDNAKDHATRKEIHNKLIIDAPFKQLIDDVVTMRKRDYQQYKNGVTNPIDYYSLLLASHDIVNERKKTWADKDRLIYEKAKPLSKRPYTPGQDLK